MIVNPKGFITRSQYYMRYSYTWTILLNDLWSQNFVSSHAKLWYPPKKTNGNLTSHFSSTCFCSSRRTRPLSIAQFRAADLYWSLPISPRRYQPKNASRCIQEPVSANYSPQKVRQKKKRNISDLKSPYPQRLYRTLKCFTLPLLSKSLHADMRK